VKQLGDSKLTRKQQQDLIHNIAWASTRCCDDERSIGADAAQWSLVVNGTARM